jgi:hypothetical protein
MAALDYSGMAGNLMAMGNGAKPKPLMQPAAADSPQPNAQGVKAGGATADQAFMAPPPQLSTPPAPPPGGGGMPGAPGGGLDAAFGQAPAPGGPPAALSGAPGGLVTPEQASQPTTGPMADLFQQIMLGQASPNGAGPSLVGTGVASPGALPVTPPPQNAFDAQVSRYQQAGQVPAFGNRR